jgi:hypothetical protein
MSIQLSSKYDPTQPFHIYYDIDIVNNDTNSNNPPPQLRFNEIRNSPYLSSPENYFMSVTRFSLQTPSLPVFIPQVMLGQPDVNKTIYSITMTCQVGPTVIEYQQFIPYIPTNLSEPSPAPPLTFQDLTSEYYFVMSYQHWARMLNNAMTLCYNGLNAAVIAAGGALPSPNAPFFEFDPQALLFILDADEVGYSNSLVNPIKIYVNNPLYTLLSSFQFTSFGFTGITNGKNYLFDIYNINNTNVLNLPTFNALQMYQEGSTSALLNPVSSLVFSTAMLPVSPSLVSVPKVFNAPSRLFNVGNNSNLAPIVTDFQVPFSPTNTYKPSVEYQPGGEYRLIDMYGTSPLSALELSVFWKDIYGGLHPFYLGAGCSATIKLMFRRKDYNTNSLFKTV